MIDWQDNDNDKEEEGKDFLNNSLTWVEVLVMVCGHWDWDVSEEGVEFLRSLFRSLNH